MKQHTHFDALDTGGTTSSRKIPRWRLTSHTLSAYLASQDSLELEQIPEAMDRPA